MIKLIVAIRKRPDMSAVDFQEHWRTRHAEVVRNSPATAKYIRKYVQPDESRFADMSKTVFFVTEEELVLDNT